MILSESNLRKIVRQVLVSEAVAASNKIYTDDTGYQFKIINGQLNLIARPASNPKKNTGLPKQIPSSMLNDTVKSLLKTNPNDEALTALISPSSSAAPSSSDDAALKSSGVPALTGEIRDGEYSDPDNFEYRYRVLGGKYYILGRPGAKAGTFNPQLVTNPKEIERIQGQIRKLNQTAVPSNVITKLAAAAGAMAAGVAMPAQSALLSFLAMREQTYNFTDPEYRQKMWYVVQAAKKRLGGKPGLIDYSDYYKAQLLDPEYKSSPGPTWTNGAAGASAFISTNPYCQLSITFGHANFKQVGDEFLVYDRYEFILDRDPSVIEAAGDYIFGIPMIKKMIDGFKQGGFKAVADFEGLLVSYQNTFNYRGYPTAIKTMKPDTSFMDKASAYASQFNPFSSDDEYYQEK